MGSGSTKFGVPTNPRVELADDETRTMRKRMEIDTPSLIKLDHGTIRYREPGDHRKPMLPRIGKPAEAPHEGGDRVGKTGYFYHPKLTDFSQSARYNKEESARFHYVQKTPISSQGRKVFFVMGVGMPRELPPEEEEKVVQEGEQQETVLEDMEAEDKENAEPGNSRSGSAQARKVEGEEKKEDGGENVEEKKEDGENKENEAEEGKEEGKEVKEGGEEGQETKEEDNNRPSLVKEFRGPLIPQSHIPRRNELPVHPGRTKIICMSKSQVYYNVEFTAPVAVDTALAASRTNLFRADGEAVAEAKDETSASPNDNDQNPTGETKEEVVDMEKSEETQKAGEGDVKNSSSSLKKEQEKEKQQMTDDIFIEVLAAGTPPVLGVVFTSTVTVTDIRQQLSEKLDVSPPKINLLHEDKYVSSRSVLGELDQGEVQEGYRHRVVLTPM